MKNSHKYLDVSEENESINIVLMEPVTLINASAYDSTFNLINYKGVKYITIDFSKVIIYDTFLYLLTKRIEKLTSDNSINLTLKGISSEMQSFINTIKLRDIGSNERDEKINPLISYFSNIGDSVKSFFNDTLGYISFIGELVQKLIVMIFKPTTVRWNDLPYLFMRTGVNAVFIVLLIVFLIGVITGYQGAMQLKQFGADIFIADLIGISITRELSPLMAAILVAGRSGSAFAAEIGTMKVSEEVDALKSMGFDIFGFLVIPRVLAVMAALPLLTLLGDVAGIIGGMLTAVSTLDISVTAYINQLQKALNYAHIFTGVGKSIIFGFLIATAGCFRGLQVQGGAESVGKYTTASVVMGILLIILSDAVFTFLFQAIGI